MHRKILLSGISFVFAIGFAACERHDWEKTKVLHQPHGDHGHGGDHSGDDHHGDDEKHPEGNGDEHHKGEKKGDAAHGGGDHSEKAKTEKAAPRKLGDE